MDMETLLQALLAVAALVVPVACAYIIVSRFAQRRAANREGKEIERRD